MAPWAPSVLFLLLQLLCVASAGAQTSRPEPTSDPAYLELIGSAVAEYQRANWVEARSLFLQAHALGPTARTAMGLGMTEFELRNYVAARQYLQTALEARQGALEPGQRLNVERLLRQTTSYVAEYVIEVTPGDARVELDGRVIDPHERAPLLVEIGHHQLDASRDGYRTLRRAIDVAAGASRTRLSLTLLPEPQPSAAGTPATQTAAPRPAAHLPANPQGSSRRAWGVYSLGVGSVLLAGAAGLLGAAVHAARSPAQSGDERSERAVRLAIAADSLGAVGAVLVTVGMVLVLKEPNGARERVGKLGWEARPTASGAQLRLVGEF